MMMYESRNKSIMLKAATAVLLVVVACTTFLVVDAIDHAAVKEASKSNPAFERSLRALQNKNNDKPSFDYFDPNEDRCDNSLNPTEDRPILEECNFSKFPTCENGYDICYNRKPSRDHFHRDNHQHKFYIQYDRVFCYPTTWGGCSSCTPGRYCKSEKRCILEEVGYPCEEWF